MKTIYKRSGAFKDRPYFKSDEIENICADELRVADLFPSTPQPIRIDRFIEKRFKISYTYDDLPEGVLGFTRFGPNGVEEIVVSRVLDTEDPVAERRVSTTLGHEAGHGLLHAYLFALGKKPRSLFEGSLSDDPLILCRKGDVMPSIPHSGHWAEFQANQAMAALLLPRKLVDAALAPYFIDTGRLGITSLDQSRRNEAVQALAQIFDVNPIVVRLRLDTFYPITPQLHL